MTEELREVDLSKIGKRVRSQRESLHMTREVAADKLGVSSKFLADIEYGEKGMSLSTFYKVIQVMNLSADYLLYGGEAESEEEGEQQRLRENIIAPLSMCNTEQLRCMEQITRYYMEALEAKGE